MEASFLASFAAKDQACQSDAGSASKHPLVKVKTTVSYFVEFLRSRPVTSVVGSLGVHRSAGDFITAAFSQVVRMMWGC